MTRSHSVMTFLSPGNGYMKFLIHNPDSTGNINATEFTIGYTTISSKGKKNMKRAVVKLFSLLQW